MLDSYTAKITAQNHQQDMLREAENERLAQQVQADQIVSRWALSLIRRSIATQPEAPKPAVLKNRKLLQDGG
jgi:hypothetical protein